MSSRLLSKNLAIGVFSVFLIASFPQQSYGWGSIITKTVKAASKMKASNIPASQAAKTACLATDKCKDKKSMNKTSAELKKMREFLAKPKGGLSQ